MGTIVGVGVGAGYPRTRPWRPPSEPGCPLWLKSTLGVTTTAGLARWLDLSGQLAHVAQDTAANKGALSGLAVRFVASNTQSLFRPAINAIQQNYTQAIALRLRSVGSTQTVWLNGADGGGNGVEISETGGKIRQDHPGVAFVDWGAPTTNPETWVFRHDRGASEADFLRDGVHKTPQSLLENNSPGGRFELGAHFGTQPADLDVYAVVAYSGRLNDTAAENLSAYLTALRNGTTLPSWRPTDEAGLEIWLERPDLWAGPHVSAWANQGTAGAARDIAQAVATKRLVLLPGANPAGGPALHSDGIDDFLRGTWTQAQPTHLFSMALVSQRGDASETVFDGASNNGRRVFTPSGANIASYAGTTALTVAADPKQWHRIEALFNGVSSKLRVDDLTPATGNAGANVSNGLIIGLVGDQASAPTDALISEIFEYDRNNLSPAAIDRAHAYLTLEYGV